MSIMFDDTTGILLFADKSVYAILGPYLNMCAKCDRSYALVLQYLIHVPLVPVQHAAVQPLSNDTMMWNAFCILVFISGTRVCKSMKPSTDLKFGKTTQSRFLW